MPVADVLAGLLAYSWKGVRFPSSGFSLRLRQDLVPHEYGDRDGAHIEGTGRAPLEFSARIPFRNGVELGPQESGVITPLYPEAFRAFLDVCIERARGELIHPELGRINCRLQEATANWEPGRRDGVDVDVSWLEDTDKPSDLANLLSTPSPVQQLAEAATAADAAIDAALERLRAKNAKVDAEVRAIVEDLKSTELKTTSFGQLARKIQAVGDQVDLANRQRRDAVDSIEYRARNISASMSRARAHPVYWPIRQAAMRMEAAAREVRDSVGSKRKRIGLYVTAADSTAPSIAQDLGVRLGDVLQLNPQLAGGPVVPSGSRVRYYLAA